MNPFNQLSPAEAERLALLAEEAAEVVQAVSKILRHGYQSRHPDGGPTNRAALEQECADFLVAMRLMMSADDIDLNMVESRADSKSQVISRYLHHQFDPIA